MYLSTKHHVGYEVYAYDADTDSVRRGKIVSIAVTQTKDSTDTRYTLELKNAIESDESWTSFDVFHENYVFGDAAAAFYSPTMAKYRAEIAAEEAAAKATAEEVPA